MRPRPLVLVIAAIAVVPLIGCGDVDEEGEGGGGAARATGGATVTIATFDFQPDPIEVEAGTTITFVNDDAIDHTVTAGTREAPTPEVFDGTLPDKGARFAVTLDEPGTYEYFCRIHPGPGMTGSITVR